MVGTKVLWCWACAVGCVLGAAKSSVENQGVTVAFLIKELPRYIPKNVKAIIPVTFEQIQNDNLNKYIAAAVEDGHELALSSIIPQSTRKSELEAFQQFLRKSKTIVEKKFGYKLKGLYNIDKMSVMSSVQKAAETNGFVIFARSFRANLMNLDYLPMQIKQATASGNANHVTVQVSIKAKADVMRLENFANKLLQLDYSVAGADANSLHTNEFEKKSSNSKANDRKAKNLNHHFSARNKFSKTKNLQLNKSATSASRKTFKSTYCYDYGHSIYESLVAAQT